MFASIIERESRERQVEEEAARLEETALARARPCESGVAAHASAWLQTVHAETQRPDKNQQPDGVR